MYDVAHLFVFAERPDNIEFLKIQLPNRFNGKDPCNPKQI